jgi:hypothetical protein
MESAVSKIIISLDGAVIKELEITKDRTTLGRRSYNDVVLDNRSVSGEHAVFVRSAHDYLIEDLNSTNGVYVNGLRVQKMALKNGDVLDMGQFKLKFVHEGAEPEFDKTMVYRAPPVAVKKPEPVGKAVVRVLSGATAGREVELVKAVSAFGKPGVAVASIVRRPHGFTVAMVEGIQPPTLNGGPLGEAPQMLKDGDVLELAGVRMQFVVLL